MLLVEQVEWYDVPNDTEPIDKELQLMLSSNNWRWSPWDATKLLIALVQLNFTHFCNFYAIALWKRRG